MLQNKRLMECKKGDDSFGCFSESCDAADADGGVGGAALKTANKKYSILILILFSKYHHALTENNQDNQHRCESSY